METDSGPDLSMLCLLFMAATIIFLLGLMTVIGTLISDILLGIMDPRIRIES